MTFHHGNLPFSPGLCWHLGRGCSLSRRSIHTELCGTVCLYVRVLSPYSSWKCLGQELWAPVLCWGRCRQIQTAPAQVGHTDVLLLQPSVFWQTDTAGAWWALGSCSSFLSALVPCFGVLLCPVSWGVCAAEATGLGGLTGIFVKPKFCLWVQLRTSFFFHTPLPRLIPLCLFLLLKQVGPVVSCLILNSHSGKAALGWPADAILHVCFVLRSCVCKPLGETQSKNWFLVCCGYAASQKKSLCVV